MNFVREKLCDLNKKMLGLYGFAALLIIWQLAPVFKLVDTQFISTPAMIIDAAAKIPGDLLIHISTSVQRVLIGYFAAILTAVPLGFLLGGWFPRVNKFLNPLFQLFGQINAFSLFPLFILFFGTKELSKFFIIYWSCIWPILFMTTLGVKNVDPLLIKSAKSMGAGNLVIFKDVILPGAAKPIFSGLNVGASRAFLMIIAAEMMGSSAGLGWFINNSNQNNVVPRIYVGAVIIAILSYLFSHLIKYIENSVITWKEDISV
ncbi:MAG: ABC transporter permease [Bacillota bacterium]|nr:ABC transporter permease [Bacillota bacterium]